MLFGSSGGLLFEVMSEQKKTCIFLLFGTYRSSKAQIFDLAPINELNIFFVPKSKITAYLKNSNKPPWLGHQEETNIHQLLNNANIKVNYISNGSI